MSETLGSLEPLPVETPLSFKDELALLSGQWYVVKTSVGWENKVKGNLLSRVSFLNLEDSVFQVEVVTDEVSEVKAGVKKLVKRTLFPGYVLVRMDLTDESWEVVRGTSGVTGFVGQGSTPVPLTLDEAAKMLAPAEPVVSVKVSKETPATLKVGDAIVVLDGPFSTLHATVSEVDSSSGKLTALVQLFGRDTPVELSFDQVTLST
jgi:transcriptional antiterminator NusG